MSAPQELRKFHCLRRLKLIQDRDIDGLISVSKEDMEKVKHLDPSA